MAASAKPVKPAWMAPPSTPWRPSPINSVSKPSRSCSRPTTCSSPAPAICPPSLSSIFPTASRTLSFSGAATAACSRSWIPPSAAAGSPPSGSPATFTSTLSPPPPPSGAIMPHPPISNPPCATASPLSASPLRPPAASAPKRSPTNPGADSPPSTQPFACSPPSNAPAPRPETAPASSNASAPTPNSFLPPIGRSALPPSTPRGANNSSCAARSLSAFAASAPLLPPNPCSPNSPPPSKSVPSIRPATCTEPCAKAALFRSRRCSPASCSASAECSSKRSCSAASSI